MNRKGVFRLILRILTVVTIVTMFGFVSYRRHESSIGKTEIDIMNKGEVRFIHENDILQLLEEKNVPFKGVSYGELELKRAEEVILEHPAVRSVEAWTTQDGTLHLQVEQRKPVLRVIDLLNDSYYIDDQGGFMPVSEEYTARVPVATGFIADRFHHQNISLPEIADQDSILAVSETDDLFAFIRLINRDALLQALTEQMYVDPNGDIELVTKWGPKTVLLGKSDDAPMKMMKLKLFYTQAIPTVGLDAYESINLTLRNQIICTKKTI
jgi:cell division protein FtsQ